MVLGVFFKLILNYAFIYAVITFALHLEGKFYSENGSVREQTSPAGVPGATGAGTLQEAFFLSTYPSSGTWLGPVKFPVNGSSGRLCFKYKAHLLVYSSPGSWCFHTASLESWRHRKVLSGSQRRKTAAWRSETCKPPELHSWSTRSHDDQQLQSSSCQQVRPTLDTFHQDSTRLVLFLQQPW